MSTNITLIAAVAQNACIGKNNKLPWHIPEDLKHFKELTTGKTVAMGRKTWESIPEKFRPLPNRTNVVITRQVDYKVPVGVRVCTSVKDALNGHATDAVFIIGGAEIYKATIDLADTLEITEFHKNVDGDVFFPTIDLNVWRQVKCEAHDGFAFSTWTRK